MESINESIGDESADDDDKAMTVLLMQMNH